MKLHGAARLCDGYRSTRLGALTAVAALALGCSKPVPPTLAPVSATVTQVAPEGISLSLVVNATNPNASDLSAQGVAARVVLNRTIDLGTVSMPQAFALPAGKTTPLAVPLDVKWSSVGALLGLAQTTGDIPFAVDGTVTMGGALLNMELPFHLEGVMTHAQMVSSAMRSLPGIGGLAPR